ncbi:MAG TPA: hypothetical protein VJ984_01885 [Xanthomonadales bacterium]|nr:hypothetical protein [Xanthomonadales bacterium]
MKFSAELLLADCKSALSEVDAQSAIHDIVQRAVSDSSQVKRNLGEPKRGGIDIIHRSGELTILNVLWGPGMTMHPHNHNMWAVIGVYGGREDNVFFRRDEEQGLVRHGTKVLEQKDTISLGESIIHQVTNPLETITAAIHIYPGDFFDTPRSEWYPPDYQERPYDVAHTLRVFEESNRKLAS